MDALSLPPASASTALATRSRLARTRLGEQTALVRTPSPPDEGSASLVTRRQVYLRKRRRKRVLIGLALILAFFPPMWAVYLVTWLVWRTRPKQRSMRHVRKAIRALEKDQNGIALQHLQDAHLLDPTNNDALYWIGLLLSKQHRQEEAEEALSLVAERVPGLPEVEGALVEAYIAMERPDSAIHHAQRLFDAAPHDPDALHKLADAFLAADRPDLAIQALEQAPLHKRTLSDDLLKIHYRLGTLYEDLGEPTRALHHFKRVYARDITHSDVADRVAALEAAE